MEPTGNSSRGVHPFPIGQNDPGKAKGKTPEQTPEQTRLNGWMRQLERVALKDAAAAEKWMTQVAHGQALADVDANATATEIASDVFNDLIRHEAYDLFVEVFTAYNKILKAHAEADGKPFKATLVLELPLDWKPSKHEEMRAAFQRIDVQRVEMVGKWEYRAKSWHLSVAACQCLATLLGNPNCQEVAIHGVLLDAAVVKEALKTSPVSSLDIPWRPAYVHGDIDLGSAKAFAPVVIDEAMSLRWKHLSIGHPNVLIRSSTTMTPKTEWPELQSLSVPLLRGPSCVPAFLKIAARSPNLVNVSLPVSRDLDLDKLKSIFLGQPGSEGQLALKGLTALKSLRQLEICGSDGKAALHVHGIPAVFEHLAACASLTHFTWDFGFEQNAPRSIDELSAEELCKPFPQLAEALKKTGLKSITLKWVSLTEGPLSSLFDALEHNTSIEELDLSTCWLDLRATRRLTEILRKNTTLKKVLLPTDPGRYFLTPRTSGQGVRYFLPASQLSRQGAPWSFQLAERDDPDFDAALKTHADTLLVQVEQALRPNAMPQLALDLAHFMATVDMLPEVREPNEPELDLTNYTDVAGKMTLHLAEQGALRAVVQLSQVAPSMNRRRDKRYEEVKPYVQVHNQVASRMDLPDAPLPINAVNHNGENRALALTMRGKKLGRFQLLLARGAIDFGRKLERTAPPGRFRDLLIATRKGRMNEIQRLAQLPVNRVDTRGANILLLAAAASKDPEQVLRARDLHAIDYGNLVFKGIPEDDKAMRAAFTAKKLDVLRPTPTTGGTATATTTTTTTTTQSTTTTTTTGTTQPRALMTRRARAPNNPDNG